MTECCDGILQGALEAGSGSKKNDEGERVMSEMKYLSVAQVIGNEHYPFTIGQIRHLLLNRKKNGLNAVIRKIGKRVYFRKDLFDEWINDQVEEEKEEVLDKNLS